ncbi:MAG: Hpt domain-containing protein [Sterolibacteriaceae bacterium MAG5]|nr:Hpt domain-containing protein [Candidatus Nitricoxidireducens bremensis]
MEAGVFDRDAALRNLGGDVELLGEIARLFVADWPANRSAILDALDRTDAPGLRVSVHAVKGAVSNFGARQAVALALDLESACKAGDLSRANQQVENLFAEVDRLASNLAREFG